MLQPRGFAERSATRPLAGPWTCWNSTAATAHAYALESPIPGHSTVGTNLNSAPTTPCACAKQVKTSRVFASLQSGRGNPADCLGHHFSADTVRHSFLLQLLVRLLRSDHRSQLESPELSGAGAEFAVSRRAVPLDAHRRGRNLLRLAPRLPSGLLLVISRHQ